MSEFIITKSIMFFMFFWTISIFFLWLRPRIEIFWKIIATLIYILYVWFFWDDVVSGYALFKAKWFVVTLAFLKELLVLVFVNLFLIWPLLLIYIFYKADDIGAERLLKFFVIFSVVIWIVLVLYVYFSGNIEVYLLENFRKMLPGEK